MACLALGMVAWGTTAHAGLPAGTWTPVPPQIIRPVARVGHTLVTFDGAGWLYGGRSPSGAGTVALTDLWEYKASTGKFARLNSTTPLPPARSGHAAAASGIYMYVFYGAGESGSLLNEVWYYDDFRHCWEPRHSSSALQPAPRIDHSAVSTAANRYLMFGGRGGDGASLLADLWGFDSLPGTWDRLPDFPDSGRYGHAAVALGGRMYVLGGTSATGVQNDVWVFDPTGNAWSLLTADGDVPDGFTGSAASAGDFGDGAGGQILLVGGQDETGMDLGATYSITVDPINHLAHWTRKADYSPVFRPAAAAVARPAGRGSALDLLVFGGTTAGTPRDQGAFYSTYVTPPSGVDLTGTWLSHTRTSKGSGSRVTWTLSGSLQVTNQGTVKSAASTLRLVLSADATPDAGDTLLKQVKVAALSPGKSKTVKLKIKLPAGQDGAGKYAIAVVDALGQVTESSEVNNSLASAPL
jgi:hypothetical protein